MGKVIHSNNPAGRRNVHTEQPKASAHKVSTDNSTATNQTQGKRAKGAQALAGLSEAIRQYKAHKGTESSAAAAVARFRGNATDQAEWLAKSRLGMARAAEGMNRMRNAIETIKRFDEENAPALGLSIWGIDPYAAKGALKDRLGIK